MASAAILGASGSLAFAQTTVPANPLQGQSATPYGAGPAANNNNNAWGVANTPTGSVAAGPLSSVYAPNVNAVPAPGTIVIRLNGRIEVDLTANYTSADKGIGSAAGNKINPLGIGSYARIYPAFDGLAANGLRYGASMEFRENFASGISPGPLNGTVPTASTTATSPSANSSNETVYVRRAFTYLASDQLGIVRLGQGDGVIGLFDNCIFTTQCWDAGVGNFNGGSIQSTSAQAGLAIPFVWLAGAGAEYANNKIVYLTPQYFGFDFGVQYAPSMGNSFQASGLNASCNQASATCINLTSGGDATRWYNQVGVGLRYQQAFGPVDFKVYGFYETAGKENLTTGAYITPAVARSTGATATLRYDNLSFYKAGVAVTAMNFTLAADYIGGAVNNQLNMRPAGGAPMNSVVTGVTYVNGPLVVGAEIGLVNDQGDARLVGVSQRRETEIAFGGSYKLAPGLQLVGEYMYEYRHQGGFDFNLNAVAVGAGGTTAGAVTRDAKSNNFLLGTVLTW
jgi:hypothetical protein